jgi:hypothetical protein
MHADPSEVKKQHLHKTSTASGAKLLGIKVCVDSMGSPRGALARN